MDGEKGTVKFIGKVRSVRDDLSEIEIYPEYCPGLMDIDGYSHIWVLYWFHERDTSKHRNVLRVVPKRHGRAEYTGVYASRSPSRPNPIGQTLVELVSVEGCRVTVRGLDALEGSPVLDLKPYSVRNECVPEARSPD